MWRSPIYWAAGIARALIVADDLPGANTSAVRMAQGGLTARTVVRIEDIAPSLDIADVVAASTASRTMPPEEAAARVRMAITAGAGVQFVAKRVDSTLR